MAFLLLIVEILWTGVGIEKRLHLLDRPSTRGAVSLPVTYTVKLYISLYICL